MATAGRWRRPERVYDFLAPLARLLVGRLADLRVVGAERVPARGGILLAANHVSFLDPVVLAGAVYGCGRRKVRFVALADLFDQPLVGWVLRGTRMIPVVRGRGVGRMAEDAGAALTAGQAVLVYPEGTIVPPGERRPARPGAGLVALRASVPVLPIASCGVERHRRPPRLRRRVTVAVGPPVDLSCWQGRLDRGAQLEASAALLASVQVPAPQPAGLLTAEAVRWTASGPGLPPQAGQDLAGGGPHRGEDEVGMVAVAEHEPVGARLQPGQAVGDSLGRPSEIPLAVLVERNRDPRHDSPIPSPPHPRHIVCGRPAGMPGVPRLRARRHVALPLSPIQTSDGGSGLGPTTAPRRMTTSGLGTTLRRARASAAAGSPPRCGRRVPRSESRGTGTRADASQPQPRAGSGRRRPPTGRRPAWPPAVGPDEDGPLASVAGRDRYVDGQGDMDLRLLWLVPVARKRGGGLNQGDPLRFLTEAIWFPASVLSRHISWEPVDPTAPGRRCARAPSKGAALFSFDEQGRPHMMAAQRYNDARRRLEHWTIPIRAYGQVHGIQVATEAGGVWNYESGDFYLPPLAHYRHSPQPTRSLPERVGKRAAAKA